MKARRTGVVAVKEIAMFTSLYHRLINWIDEGVNALVCVGCAVILALLVVSMLA